MSNDNVCGYTVHSVYLLGTHDGHILVFNIPPNGRNIYLRETIKGNMMKFYFIIYTSVICLNITDSILNAGL